MLKNLLIILIFIPIFCFARIDPTAGMPIEIQKHYELLYGENNKVYLPKYKMFVFRNGEMLALLDDEAVHVGDVTEDDLRVDLIDSYHVILVTPYGDRREVLLNDFPGLSIKVKKNSEPSQS